MRHSLADCTLVLKASYYRHRVSNHIWARCISAVRSAVIHHCTQSNLMSFSRLCRDSVLMDLRSQSPSNINRDQWGADWEALRRLLRSCGACKQCNIRASDQTNKPHKHHMHSFSDLKRSNTCTHTHTHTHTHARLVVTYLIPFHKSTASLQTLGHAHSLELKRMNARLSSSHSSFNIYTQSSAKKISRVSLFLLRKEAQAERPGWQRNSCGEWKRFTRSDGHLDAFSSCCLTGLNAAD